MNKWFCIVCVCVLQFVDGDSYDMTIGHDDTAGSQESSDEDGESGLHMDSCLVGCNWPLYVICMYISKVHFQCTWHVQLLTDIDAIERTTGHLPVSFRTPLFDSQQYDSLVKCSSSLCVDDIPYIIGFCEFEDDHIFSSYKDWTPWMDSLLRRWTWHICGFKCQGTWP